MIKSLDVYYISRTVVFKTMADANNDIEQIGSSK